MRPALRRQQENRRRCPPRSPSSAANGSPSPNRPANLPNATSMSRAGLSTTAAVTSPPSPEPLVPALHQAPGAGDRDVGSAAARRSGAGTGDQVTVTDSYHPALRMAPAGSSRRQCPRDRSGLTPALPDLCPPSDAPMPVTVYPLHPISACRFSPRMSLQVLLSCGSAGFSSVCRRLSSHVLVVSSATRRPDGYRRCAADTIS